MRQHDLNPESFRLLSGSQQIDILCECFESEWKLGTNPNPDEFVRSYIPLVAPENRDSAIVELRATEDDCRRYFPLCSSTRTSAIGELQTSVQFDDERRATQCPFVLPFNLGPFVLNSFLGAGSSGCVFKATRNEGHHVFAIKIAQKSLCREGQRWNLQREARIASKLRHANIIRVHEAGKIDEYEYVLSDFVDAVNLREFIQKSGPLSFVNSVGIIADLAQALWYAHQLGFVHRDIKPSNILIAETKESALGGDLQCGSRFKPYLIDFGLARRLDPSFSITNSGQFLGTPSYSSPEQALGDSNKVDHRSDIYSLGVVLYELLGYAKPFSGTVQSILNRISQEEVPSIRNHNLLIERALAEIVHKCLRLNPEHRYQSAIDLASDLQKWATGKPNVKLRAYSTTERIRILSKSYLHNNMAYFGATVLLIAAVAVSLTVWHRRELSSSFTATAETQIDAVPIETAALSSVRNSSDEVASLVAREDDASILRWIDSASIEKLSKSIDLLASNAEVFRSSLRRTTDSFLSAVNPLPSDFESEEESILTAKRILVLYAIGDFSHIWPHLVRLPDPRVRTHFVHLLSQTDLTPVPLINELGNQHDPAVLYVILITLFNYDLSSIELRQLETFRTWVKMAYQSNPNPGIHAMCRLQLIKWNEGPFLDRVNQQFRSEGISKDHDWYVNSEGIQFAIIRGPVTFWSGRRRGETLLAREPAGRWQTIDYSYAIAMEDLTVEQFCRFDSGHRVMEGIPDSSPLSNVSWVDSSKYCEWLTVRDGLANSDANTVEFLDENRAVFHSDRLGYRLPTVAEWECAARQFSQTDWCFGQTKTMKIVRESRLSRTALLTGEYLPNMNGLRNVVGGLSNWTVDSFVDPSDDGHLDLRGAVHIKGGLARSAEFRKMFEPAFVVPKTRSPVITLRIARRLPE